MDAMQTAFINGWQMKSVQPPKDLNEIFTLVNMHLKPKFAMGSGGMGSTFATTADTIERKSGDGKGKRQRGKHQQGQGKDDKSDKSNNSDGSEKTDGSVQKKAEVF